jgi:putative transposase
VLLQHCCNQYLLLSYKYRLYPNDEQEARLKSTLAGLCEVYNELRNKKVEKYKQERINLSKTDLRRLTLEIRMSNLELKKIHSQVVQNVADRVSCSFNNFFEKRSRFPRIKKYKNFKSFTYPQSGFGVLQRQSGHALFLSGIGLVRIFFHRPVLGKVNRLTIKREAGEWYAVFLIDKEEDVRPKNIPDISDDRIRGGDLGLEKFITLDDSSNSADYPKFLGRSQMNIIKLQRRLSKKKKGSNNWKKLAFRLARLHLHIKRQREDYQNKLVSTLLNKDTDMLVLEKLSVENMLQNHCLAKSLSDASFGRFATKCLNKSVMLGKYLLFVDPWGTSEFCYNCLGWVPKDLSEREHNCPRCGVSLPRDRNSAKLIKWLGIHSCPPSDGGSSPAELLPLPSLRRLASIGEEAGSLRIPHS